MTPPTARKRPTATRSAARPAEPAAGESRARRFVGADGLAQRAGERVLPGGVTHVVEGWHPVCGEPRVRFVFPGCTLDDAAEACDACSGSSARALPRQRRASTA